MLDDLANRWGINLVRPDGRKKPPANLLDNGAFFDRVERDLHAVHGSWRPMKICPNGSEANHFAVYTLTEGVSTLLIACGSYVAGDMGPLQGWSTCKFNVDDGPVGILSPQEVVNPTAKKQTVPVAYHIPGTMSNTDLNEYEDSCLLRLHHRCLLQRTQGNPVRGMFLELVLASNGSTLSDRYLTKLGLLAKHHSFHFVIDEILTGGRYGVILLTGTKPVEFVNRVAFITLGKWMQAGMVLASAEQRNVCAQQLTGMSVRGQFCAAITSVLVGLE